MSSRVRRKRRDSKPAYTFKRSGDWHVQEFPGHALRIGLNKPTATAMLQMLGDCPNWCRAIEVARRALSGAELTEEERTIRVPPEEHRDLAAFMSGLTRWIEGVVDGTQAVTWEMLDEDERVRFWEVMPQLQMKHTLGAVLGRHTADNNPELIKRLDAVQRERLERVVGESLGDDEDAVTPDARGESE